MCTSKDRRICRCTADCFAGQPRFHSRRGPDTSVGCLLDVVATRDDLPVPTVLVDDIGLSDHYLLHWSTPFVRPEPVYTTSVRRPWRRISIDDLRDAIRASALGRPELLPVDTDVDRLATLYCRQLLAIADRLTPVRTVRPPSPVGPLVRRGVSSRQAYYSNRRTSRPSIAVGARRRFVVDKTPSLPRSVEDKT
jgi:hypothetical protein